MPRLLKAIASSAASLFACLLLCRCDADDDDVGSDAGARSCSSTAPGADTRQEWEHIVDGLSGEYRGTIEDGNGDVPCRYDGHRFSLTLSLDPDSVCASASFCARSPFSCDLSGSIEIDDMPSGDAEARVFVVSGTSAGLSVGLASFAVADGGLDAQFMPLEGASVSRQLGGVGGHLYWSSRRNSGSDDPAWENCLFTIEEIR